MRFPPVLALATLLTLPAIASAQSTTFRFQEGVDSGFGVYSGTQDAGLSNESNAPNAPSGDDPSILVTGRLDRDDPQDRSAVLRFDNLLQSEGGPIAPGATVVSARIGLTTVDGQVRDGSIVQLLGDFGTEDSVTYENLQLNGNSVAGIQFNVADGDVDALNIGQLAPALPGGATSSADVTGAVADWASGSPNYGFGLTPNSIDGFDFEASEDSTPANRPKLTVETPDGTFTFQEGLNGYTGTQDAVLFANPADADTPNPDQGDDGVSVDGRNNGGLPSHGVLRFDNIFGTDAGQIPLGTTIDSALLELVIDSPTREGAGPSLHQMLGDFGSEDTVTWNNLQLNGNTEGGIQFGPVDGVQLLATVDDGTPELEFDVTDLAQAWIDGEPNFGLGFVPAENGTYEFASSEATDLALRPFLEIVVASDGPGGRVIPEPSTAVLALGLCSLLVSARRRK